MNFEHPPQPSISPYRQEKNGEDRIRDVNDFRTLRFFAHRINSASTSPVFNAVATNEKSTIKPALIDYLVAAYPDAVSRQTAVNWLISEAANNLIPLDQFDWLKENQDACCAIWGYLSTAANRFAHGQFTGHQLIDSYPDDILYHQLSINPKPTSHSDRFECIKNYFDTWIIGPSYSVNIKFTFIANIKDRWLSMLKEVKTLNWLTKPEREQCEWAWNYLQDYHRKETAEMRFGIYLINSFYPINDHEKFLAIYAALRIWSPHKAEKTLLLKNMNRAWRERERRRDREDKKAINSYVDVKVKKRLDLLARYNRCQINEVLTDLINREYALRKDEIDRQFNI